MVGACTDDGGSLHVICSIVPKVSANECTYDPEGGKCKIDGVLNLAAATHYASVLRVESGLKSRASNVPPRPEPNRIALHGGSVELRKGNGAPIKFDGLKNPYDFLGSGFVAPGGRGFMSVTLIPTEYVDQLRENAQSGDALDQIVLAVTAKGETDGQVDVESSEWLWPMRLTYQSPVEGEDGCFPNLPVCLGEEGTDQSASACLCAAGDECGFE